MVIPQDGDSEKLAYPYIAGGNGKMNQSCWESARISLLTKHIPASNKILPFITWEKVDIHIKHI